MKNKRGFTLIEVLTVLIILSIVVVIAVPVVDEIVKSSRQKVYLTQMQAIKDATKTMIAEKIFLAPDEYNSKVTIELEELIRGGYVEKDIKNAVTKKPMTGVKVVVTYEKGSLVYTVYDNDKVVDFD